MAGRLSPIARAPVVAPANSLIQNSNIVNESINRCFTKALDYSMRVLRQSKRRKVPVAVPPLGGGRARWSPAQA